jgi:hypothetical protein
VGISKENGERRRLMADQEPPCLGDDLMRGAKPIAEFIFGDPSKARQVAHLREQQKQGKCDIPLFLMNGRVCGRKSAILDWIKAQETVSPDGGEKCNAPIPTSSLPPRKGTARQIGASLARNGS